MTTNAALNIATPEISPAPATRGMVLPCPKCGQDATITLNLADLDSCQCVDCEEEFSLDTVRAIVETWGAVLRWIDSAPSIG